MVTKKPDEIKLWRVIKNNQDGLGLIKATKCFDEINMNYKRGYYLLEKWFNHDLVGWGVSPNYFWLTDKGKETESLGEKRNFKRAK